MIYFIYWAWRPWSNVEVFSLTLHHRLCAASSGVGLQRRQHCRTSSISSPQDYHCFSCWGSLVVVATSALRKGEGARLQICRCCRARLEKDDSVDGIGVRLLSPTIVEECRKDHSWRCCTQMAAKHRGEHLWSPVNKINLLYQRNFHHS